MKQTHLFALWGGLFILCAGLGFIPEPAGALALVLRLVSLAFFVCPAVLLWQAAKIRDFHTLQLLRNLSLASLGLTLALLIANLAAAAGSEWLGTALHYMLVIVSAPMIASGHWALSLFLWACLLTASLKELRKGR